MKFAAALLLALVACDPCKDCPSTCASRIVEVSGWMETRVIWTGGSNYVPIMEWHPAHLERQWYCPAKGGR